MKKIMVLFTAMLCFCLFFNVDAQKKNTTFKLKGEVVGRQIDSIRVDYYPTYSWVLISPLKQIFEKVVNGRFSITIENVTDIQFIKMYYITKGKTVGPGGGLTELPFYIEPGDEITVEINAKSENFNGRSSGKFQFINEVSKITVDEIFDTGPFKEANKKAIAAYGYRLLEDLRLKRADSLLNFFRNKISKSVFDLIKFDLLCQSRFNLLTVIQSDLYGDSSIIEECKKYLIANSTYLDILSPNAEIAEKSTLYSDVLFSKETITTRLDKDQIRDVSAYFPRIFNNISTRYHGAIRDKLLLSCLFPNVKRDTSDYFKQALQIVESPLYKMRIADMAKFAKGSKFYNFELEDTNGKLIKLTDFRNKIVYIDFYFTGCSGCAKIAKAVKPVIHEFKDNPNVVFISINVDPTKDMFLKAVQSGIYTESSSINLYTNGKGPYHDLIKYYGFDGYPQTFLLDKSGELMVAKLPGLRLDAKTEGPNPNDLGVKELISLIKKGLAEHIVGFK